MNHFFKSLLSLTVLFGLLFYYMNLNIENAKLNRKFSKITFLSIELEDDIKLLEVKYNNQIRNQDLETRAIAEFKMDMPLGDKIVRLQDN